LLALQQDVAQEAAKKVWLSALDANPGNVLLHLCYSSFLEACGLFPEALSVFDVMLERDAFSAQDKVSYVGLHETSTYECLLWHS
jgi:hypothetical protein